MGEGGHIIFEVVSFIDEKTVRAIALTFNIGISRGDSIWDTGQSLMIPVGKEILGKMFDVFGNQLEKAR